MLAFTYLVLIAKVASPALKRFDRSIRLDGLKTRLGSNIQALTRSVLDSDVKIVSDEKFLARRVVRTSVDSDATSIGRVIAEVDTSNLTGVGIEYLDLSGTEVVVEKLKITWTARGVLTRTNVEAASTA